jgi:hypothetical protein
MEVVGDMSADARLPGGFEALERFARWAAASAPERDRLRAESNESDRAAFYEAARDLIAPALALLDRKAFADFDEREQRLMRLVLSFAHVAIAVEIQGDIEEQRAPARRHLRITRASADL